MFRPAFSSMTNERRISLLNQRMDAFWALGDRKKAACSGRFLVGAIKARTAVMVKRLEIRWGLQ
jgi:hypothetical protein